MKHQRTLVISLVMLGLVVLTVYLGIVMYGPVQSQAMGPTFEEIQTETEGEALADPLQRIVRCCYGLEKGADSISSPYADPEQRIVRCCYGMGKSPDSISSPYADPEQRIVRCCFGR